MKTESKDYIQAWFPPVVDGRLLGYLVVDETATTFCNIHTSHVKSIDTDSGTVLTDSGSTYAYKYDPAKRPDNVSAHSAELAYQRGRRKENK